MPHLERMKMPSILNPEPGGSPFPQKTLLLSKHLRATDRGDWEGAGRQAAGKGAILKAGGQKTFCGL